MEQPNPEENGVYSGDDAPVLLRRNDNVGFHIRATRTTTIARHTSIFVIPSEATRPRPAYHAMISRGA